MIKKPSTDSHNSDDFTFEDEEASADIAKKLKQLRDKLKNSEEEKMTNLAGWQRAQADYSNLKANSEKERQVLAEIIKAGLIDDFIPLADSFAMAMANHEAWEAVPANWRKGVEHIYSQLGNILANQGVEVIDPIGKIFDPIWHESVGLVTTTKPDEDHMVLEVIKKGYRLGERIIRPAQVKIGEYK
ncbi:MAG: nucleotide exchange factor GrpE [Candidatus Vogelbacteria bacterium RIFOXYD1_FULL_44_32]|uniref:Protein GrpE n=1 Tax=Candidatus Vogelbacteria bacterium RIFOXYD1_FULL_44_32 TaxID=1802438 RepID=A0A1G2QF72_9BACT|nr:MAG: nucleotide exchange factor GrpE [Candidatus Vogelbacteria bacterium RIFOXYD1_FULL_44_32]